MAWWVWVTSVIGALLLVVLLILLFKLYIKLSTGWDRSPTCLIGKTAIVTGANSGIGFYTAQDFATRGAKVILACRDPVRAEEARRKIVQATRNPNVHVKILDLSSLAAVREFARDVLETEERLDILVNNAGAAGFDYRLTKDNLSLSMQTNHFGPFLLTILLLDLLKRSAPSRIVNVSSRAANMARLDVNDLNRNPGGYFGKSIDYANAKLCNILIANELARKLRNIGVTANSIHPGAVQTEFYNKFPSFYKKLFATVAKAFYKTTEEGAQTTIYAAVSPDLDGVTGTYFGDCQKLAMVKKARAEGLAKKVWDKSEEFVKLTSQERQILNQL